MAKVLDITDKLNFEEQPEMIIKGVHIKINNSAENMLKLMSVVNNEDDLKAIEKSIPLLLEKEEKKKLDSLKLSFNDYVTVFRLAMELVQGEDDIQGEQ